jgi:2-polyprenyl-3-methyl-5-hydroxy-6-metoxy-1,4-benzoquinol methylase
MSERHGLWSPLSSPWVYEAFHHLIGARRWLKRFTNDVIRPRSGDRIFDIGCGPGALLRCLPAETAYVGFDRNEAYIKRARRMNSDRGEFICDDVGNFASHALAPANIAVAIGILHHLDDERASSMLRAAANALKPGGRMITADPCFHPEQSALQRFVVSNDRGMHVRPFEQYVELVGAVFPEAKATFQRGHVPFPRSICIMQAMRGLA